jgi:hypothetical protein
VSGSRPAAAVGLTPVRDEMLEVSLSLPTGWSVEVEPESSVLTCVAGDDLDSQGLRPSITVEKHPTVGWDALLQVARGSLADMRQSYDGFALVWSREDRSSSRVVRCYDFDVPGLGRRVRQVQGLVSGEGLFVVNCTRPAEAAPLEDVFAAVVASLSAR